jgi:hypothetical protein
VCEPFTVDKSDTSLVTHVLNASNVDVTNTKVPLGTTVHDTATLTPTTSGFSLAGTVVYTFYRGGDCLTGTADASPQSVSVSAAGVVPASNTKGPLTTGSYAFSATYTPAAGSSYNGDTAVCEPFTVDQASTQVATVVYSDATKTPIGLTVPVGSKVYDTATVSGKVGAITPTGTVTFYFYSGVCGSGTLLTTQAVALQADGTAKSSASAALTSGQYYYVAVYGGDANYKDSTGPCEPFATGNPPLTPGYWKNHLGKTVPLIQTHQPFYIGAFLFSGSTTQIGNSVTAIFKNMNCSNSSAQNAIGCLAGQLLAARLNLANNAVDTIDLAVNSAQQFLGITGSAVTVTYAGLTAKGIMYTGPTATFSLTSAQRALAVKLSADLSAYNASGV